MKNPYLMYVNLTISMAVLHFHISCYSDGNSENLHLGDCAVPWNGPFFSKLSFCQHEGMTMKNFIGSKASLLGNYSNVICIQMFPQEHFISKYTEIRSWSLNNQIYFPL